MEFTVKQRQKCSWVQFLIGMRPMRSFSPVWGSRHHCPMEVGACIPQSKLITFSTNPSHLIDAQPTGLPSRTLDCSAVLALFVILLQSCSLIPGVASGQVLIARQIGLYWLIDWMILVFICTSQYIFMSRTARRRTTFTVAWQLRV